MTATRPAALATGASSGIGEAAALASPQRVSRDLHEPQHLTGHPSRRRDIPRSGRDRRRARPAWRSSR